MVTPSKERIEELGAYLESPVILEASEEVLKTRFRLLVVGSLSFALGYFDLRIAPGSSILGLHIAGFTDQLVRGGFFIVTLYLLVHFAWSIWDAFVEWRLRLTGFKELFVPQTPTAPRSARQSTLYAWWVNRARQIQDIPKTLDGLWVSSREFAEAIKAWEQATQNPDELLKKWQPLNASLHQLRTQMSATTPVTHGMVEASLQRFDNWFRYFVASQNLRWFLFDFALPIAIGVAALAILAARIFDGTTSGNSLPIFL